MKKTLTTTLLTIITCLCIAFGLTACNKCKHTYDNVCDTTCNKCNETREITHTPETDDGDCTTAVKCVNCFEVLIAGYPKHTDTDSNNVCNNPGCEQLIITASEGLAFAEIKNEQGEVVGYSVTGLGECTDTDIVIPATYGDDNKPVTTIGESAFYNTALTSVTIPASVTEISEYAFCNCSTLTSVTFGANNQLTTIGNYAFAYTSLTSITIPASVTSIGNDAFAYCSSLTSVTFDDGSLLKTIGEYAFDECTSLTSVTFGANSRLTTIGDSAFYECTSLTSITIPDSVQTIGEYAFSYTALTSVTFGANSQLQTIGEDAFYSTALTSITIPDSVQTICDSAFSYTALSSVTFDDGSLLKTIGDWAFDKCTSLTSITIPASVTSIGNYAFYSTALTSITIPASVTSIGNDAFYGCSFLTSVTFGANSQLQTIGDWAFAHTSLTSITIPDSVTSIGNYAFYECTALTSVYYVGTDRAAVTIGDYAIPDNATVYYYSSDMPTTTGKYWHYVDGVPTAWEEIKSLAFAEIKNEQGEVVGYSVTGLGTYEGTDVVIPATVNGKPVTAIGENAFNTDLNEACTSLTSVTIPDSVTTIGEYAFFWCFFLESVTFGEGSQLTTIGEQAFRDCTGLTSVTIPASVTEIGYQAFLACINLTSVTFGENSKLTTIGKYAFDICTGLTSIYYGGTEADWKKITIGDFAIPDTATVYYYSSDMPTTAGKYWHYVDGEPTAWEEIKSLKFAEIKNEQGEVVGYSVTGLGTYEGTDVVIPATYGEDNLPVQTIGEAAFYGRTSLTSVTIPASVTEISEYAFYGCTSLTSVTFDDGSLLMSIGEEAFYECTGLTSVTIPDSVTSIGMYAFYKCTALTSVTIPVSVETIGDSAFSSCSSLTSVYYGGTQSGWKTFNYWYQIDSRVVYYYSEGEPTTAGNYWYYENGEPTVWDKVALVGVIYQLNEDGESYTVTGLSTSFTGTEVTIPATVNDKPVTAIGDHAFAFCESLESVTIPDSVETIGDYAFKNSALASITIPNSVTTIGIQAFVNTALKSVTIPASVETIGEYAFYGCSKLESVTIPDSVTTIGNDAFFGCESLTSVTIPASVTTIGNDAFFSCLSLTSVYYGGTQDEWTSLNVNVYIIGIGEATFYIYSENQPETAGDYWHYVDGVPTAWKEIKSLAFAEIKNEQGEVVGYSVTGLGDYESTDVVIPATYGNDKPVTAIGDQAFYGTALTSITIPNSVTTIGNDAFFSCISLTSVNISENSQLQTIGDYAFQNTALTSITIPNSVTTIGETAFSNTALTSITIPNSVTTIGNQAFSDCSALTSVTFGENSKLQTIGDNAFYYCFALTSVTFGENSKLQTIGDNAFLYNSALTSVTIPASVETIGEGAFDACYDLTSVTFGENSKLQTIGVSAFQNSALTSITIPNSVTTIGNKAFYGTALTSVTIPASVTTIGNQAFRWCSSLTSVYYGGTEADWGDVDKITIGDDAIPTNATVYYYSSDMPTTAGNYWHYDAYGVPTTEWKD